MNGNEQLEGPTGHLWLSASQGLKTKG